MTCERRGCFADKAEGDKLFCGWDRKEWRLRCATKRLDHIEGLYNTPSERVNIDLHVNNELKLFINEGVDNKT